MNLANRLRVAREAAGMTQTVVSRASGIAVPNLSKIESGRVDLRLSTLDRVLDALGLKIQLVPKRDEKVSLDDVMSWSRQGRERLAEVRLEPSRAQERLNVKRRHGIDIAAEQSTLNTRV